MNVTAAIRRLLEQGFTVEQALVAAEAFEQASVEAVTPRQARNKRYYEASKASEKRLKASEQDVSDADALPSKEVPQTPKETQPSLPTTQQEKTPKGVQKKASRLPADWMLPDEWRQDAIAVGLPPPRVDIEAAKMRDWSRSSKNGAKLDWRASWRNWCRGAAENIAPGRPPPPGRPVDNLITSLITRMDHADANAPTEIEGYSTPPLRLSAG